MKRADLTGKVFGRLTVLSLSRSAARPGGGYRDWWNCSCSCGASAEVRPSPDHSIDRYPDPNGNYEPGNCRWATYKEQNNNRNTNVWVEFEGKRLTIAQWSEVTGLSHSAIRQRLIAGWEIPDALTKPSMRGAHA